MRFSKGLQATVNTPLDEGSTAALNVTFEPADPTQQVILTVNWDDGGDSIESFTVAAGGSQHTFNRPFADDNPTIIAGRPQDHLGLGNERHRERPRHGRLRCATSRRRSARSR